MKQTIYVYGLAGAEQQYRVIRYSFFNVNKVKHVMEEVRIQADWLRSHDSAIEYVYAVDGGNGLKYMYLDAVKRRSVETNVLFKTLLEQRGIPVPLD